MKNSPISRGISVLLVLAVLAATLVTGTLSNGAVATAPDDVIVDVTADPEYYVYIPELEEPRFEEPGDAHLLTPDTGIMTTCPLTGMPLDEARAQNRPLAVVIANCVESVPMNGVYHADVIYEILVEGGMTRMLAVFQDFSEVQKVGSIRSARHYTVELAHSHNAFLIHAGGSQPYAYNLIAALGVTNFDEVGGVRREIFFRDRQRIPGRRLDSLHSVVTTNERVARFFPQFDLDLEHDPDFEQGWVFSDDATPANGSPATRAVVQFTTGGKSTTFTFDENENAYFVNQFRRDFVDANNALRPSFANVIVLRTSVTAMPGDGAGRQDMVTIGEGEGYFLHGGRYVPITWSREDRDSPFVFTNMDGSLLELGRGSTYICIIPNNVSIDIGSAR